MFTNDHNLIRDKNCIYNMYRLLHVVDHGSYVEHHFCLTLPSNNNRLMTIMKKTNKDLFRFILKLYEDEHTYEYVGLQINAFEIINNSFYIELTANCYDKDVYEMLNNGFMYKKWHALYYEYSKTIAICI